MIKRTALAAAVLMAVAIGSAGAAEMVGWNKHVVPPKTDVLVSVPFSQSIVGTYTVTAVVSGTGVQVAGPLTTDQYKNVYYVRFTSGNAAGRWSTVTGNTTTQLTLQDATFLGGVANGDSFTVYRHHTLATLLPDEMENIAFQKTSFSAKTQILVPTTNGAVINRSAGATYVFKNVSGVNKWVTTAGVDSDNVVLSPQEHFTVRNNDAAVTLTLMISGNCQDNALVRNLPREAAANDVVACTGRPVPVTLSQLNLAGTPAFAASSFTIQDKVLVFNNADHVINKSATWQYYYKLVTVAQGGDGQYHWRRLDKPVTYNADNDVLPAGCAIVIRKVATTGGGTPVTWNQPAPF